MLRFVVIGVGKAGAAFADAILAHPDASLVGVVGGATERHQTFAHRYRTIALADLETAAVCPADVAIVATPHHLHVEQVACLLESGKHVIVEKPAALDTSGLRRLYEAAAATDRRVFVGFVQRCSPAVVEARQYVLSRRPDLLGAAVTQWLFRDIAYYQGWKGDPVAAGGGCLVNQAIHAIDLALWITGLHPTRIRCRTRALRSIRVEDSVAGTLENDAGQFVDIAAATCSIAPERQLLRLFFPDTTALIMGTETPHYAVVHSPEQAADVLAELATLPDDYAVGHARLLDDVISALCAGVPTIYGCELDNTLNSHAVLFAMYASAELDAAPIVLEGVQPS